MKPAVNHLSFSAIETFCNNPAMFVKQYINGERREEQSITTLIGSAVHKGIEQFIDGHIVQSPQELLQHCIDEGVSIRETKTITLEKAYQLIQEMVDDVQASWDLWEIEEIISNEMKYQDYLTIHGSETMIPVSGKIDMIAKVAGKVVVWDWKTVDSYTSDTEKLKYIIQAHIYMALARQQYDEPVELAVFAEIKRIQNRDKSPRVKFVKIQYDPTTMKAIIELCNRITLLLGGEPMFNQNGDILVLPNFSDMYSARESWNEFLKTI